MRILFKNGLRTLIKDCGSKINISDGQIIVYTGVYYKTINDIIKTVEFETSFAGKVRCERYDINIGTTGIYVDPLFIFNIMHNKWKKIEKPKTANNYKYFLYPHLLMLPGNFYHFRPLYTLHTVENQSLSLSDFDHITEIMYHDTEF